MMKLIFSLLLSITLLSFASAGFGYNNLDGPILVPAINYSLIPTVNSSDWWDGLNTPADIDHNLLNNLEWSNAGHTMDADLDMNGNDIRDAGYLEINQTVDDRAIRINGFSDPTKYLEIDLDGSGYSNIDAGSGFRLQQAGSNIAFISTAASDGFRLYDNIPISFGSSGVTRFNIVRDSGTGNLEFNYNDSINLLTSVTPEGNWDYGDGDLTTTGDINANDLNVSLINSSIIRLEITTDTGGYITQKDPVVEAKMIHFPTPTQQSASFRNVFIGWLSGVKQSQLNNSAQRYFATGNVGIGSGALSSIKAGFYNFALGSSTLQLLDDANSNVAIGHQAGQSIIGGSGNMFIGRTAGEGTEEGDNNIAIGNFALFSNVDAGSNTIIGSQAAFNSITAARNIIIGFKSGFDETASDTLMIDNRDRTSEELGRTGAIIYGKMAASPTNQDLFLNADVYLKDDNRKLFFGEGDDSSIYFDGTNLVINANEVSDSKLDVSSKMTVGGDIDTLGNFILGGSSLFSHTGNFNIYPSGQNIVTGNGLQIYHVASTGDIALTSITGNISLVDDVTIYGDLNVTENTTIYSFTDAGFVKNDANGLLLGGQNITPSDITRTFETADAIDLVDGTSSDTISNLTTYLDGFSYHIDEATGVPGTDFRINFTGITMFAEIMFKAFYEGSSTHWVEFQIYDYDSASWKVVMTIENSNGLNTRAIFWPDYTNFISGGVVQTRFYHPTTGNSSHDFYLDYIAITD